MRAAIRPQRREDDPAVREVLQRSFADHGRVAELGETLRSGPAPSSRVSLVAEVGETVVGHVQLSRCWLDAALRLVDVLVLSPLGVDPEVQGRGIGGQLVRDALDRANSAGVPLVFLEGSPRYYPRFGFEPACGLGFTPPSARIPHVAFQVVTTPSWQPWMTGPLVYCDAFWALDCVGLRA